MKQKVENLDELRSEILRVKMQQYQQEAILDEHFAEIKEKVMKPVKFFKKIGNMFGGGGEDDPTKPDSVKNPEDHQDWVTAGLRVGIPLFLNKVMFRNSGMIMKLAVALLSQKAAVNVNKDIVSTWINKAADFIKKKKNRNGMVYDHPDYGIPPDSETY